jgi:hypothetical protein
VVTQAKPGPPAGVPWKNLAVGDDGSGTKTNMLVPGILTLTMTGLVGYHYGTMQSYDHSMLHFLSMLLLQMMPLLALKFKIYQCGDRLSLLPRTLVKTLLMHLILSILRMCPPLMRKNHPLDLQFYLDLAGFLGALYILKRIFNYQFSMRMFTEEREVRNLVLMAAFGAMITETLIDGVLPTDFSLSELTKNFIQDKSPTRKFVFTFANYLDVVAFMPVVMKLYEIEREDDCSAGTAVAEDVRKQVLMFFAYVISFYSWDDVIDPVRDATYDISMMAHAAHYVLLLDFACFFTFQVWSPSSAKGEQMQGLLEQTDYDADY